MEVDFSMRNGEDFIRVLRESMPHAAADGVIAGALLKASRPMVGLLKQFYRQMAKSGSLAAAARSWRIKHVGLHHARVHVGPMQFNAAAMAKYIQEYGRTPAGGSIRHGHLIERGTIARRTKSGARRGSVTGRYPLRRAAEATLPAVNRIFVETLYSDMTKALAKRNRPK